MNWTIDTGRVGAEGVAPKDLKSFLTKEIDTFEALQGDQAYGQVMSRKNRDLMQNDHKYMQDAHTEASQRRDEVRAQIRDMRPQIEKCIAAADLVASGLGGNVTVSLTGHQAEDHPSGAAERVTISVDLVG